MKRSILIVEDNLKLLNLMANHFRGSGYEVHTTTALQESTLLLKEHNIGVIVLDLMLNNESGMDGIEGFIALDPNIQIIIATGYATVETAVEAMKKGAYDYIQKPVDIHDLHKTIDNAFRFRQLKRENTLLKRQLLSSNYCLQTNSPALRSVLDKAQKLSRTDLPILLLGESGTGKEVLADFIHTNSNRQGSPSVKVNSSAFPETLLENELFGHEKDSFTGASATYKGVFEQSDKGTLFLDEIGDMSLSIQAKILRVLQNHEIRRIGASRTISVDVRLIAATNMDPALLIREKKFREDLFYRINTAVLKLPPLRERKEDIALLVQHFVRIRTGIDRHQEILSPEVQRLFKEYNWPGNIRELSNTVDYALALSNGSGITLQHMPPFLQSFAAGGAGELPKQMQSDDSRRAVILQTLEACRFNKKQAAEQLGISRKTLYERMKKYEIDY